MLKCPDCRHTYDDLKKFCSHWISFHAKRIHWTKVNGYVPYDYKTGEPRYAFNCGCGVLLITVEDFTKHLIDTEAMEDLNAHFYSAKILESLWGMGGDSKPKFRTNF